MPLQKLQKYEQADKVRQTNPLQGSVCASFPAGPAWYQYGPGVQYGYVGAVRAKAHPVPSLYRRAGAEAGRYMA